MNKMNVDLLVQVVSERGWVKQTRPLWSNKRKIVGQGFNYRAIVITSAPNEEDATAAVKILNEMIGRNNAR